MPPVARSRVPTSSPPTRTGREPVAFPGRATAASHAARVSSEASVALISGAVVAVSPETNLTRSNLRSEEERILSEVADLIGGTPDAESNAPKAGEKETKEDETEDDAS